MRSADAASSRPVAAPWPFFGRLAELDSARAALTHGGVIFAGPAGAGKSRLMRELLTVDSSVRTHRIAATFSTRDIPLGAFAGLARFATSPWAVQHAIDGLLGGQTGTDVVVAVDDAHLLDDLSAVVVHQLAVHRLAKVVLTIRADCPVPDAVTALWKDAYLARVEVAPLSQADMAGLLVLALGSAMEPRVLQQVWAMSAGNMSYVHELVSRSIADGGIQLIDGIWRWADDAAAASGTGLAGSFGQQPVTVNEEIADLLCLAEPLEVEVLSTLVGDTAVEEAETAGLITIQEQGPILTAALTQPMFAQSRQASLVPDRARVLRGSIIRALESRSTSPEIMLKRAILSIDSDQEPDHSLLLRGSHYALMLCDMVLAEKLAGAAVAAGGGFACQFMFAYAATLGNAEHAEPALTALTDSLGGVLTDEQAALVAVVRSGELFWTRAKPGAALGALDTVAEAATDVAARLMMSAVRSAYLATLGRPAAALAAGNAALSYSALPDLGVVFATWGAGIALGVQGKAEEVAELIERGYGAAESPYTAGMFRFILSAVHEYALRQAGLLQPALELSILRVHEARRLSSHALALATAILGQTRLHLGELSASVEMLRDALTRLPFDRQGRSFSCFISLVHALALRGEVTAARAALIQLEAASNPAIRYLGPEAALALSSLYAAEGDIAAARRQAQTAATIAVELAQPIHEVLALHALVRLGDSSPAVRLTKLAGLVDGPRASAAAAHACALRDRDGDGLLTAAAQLAAFGDVIAAMDAFAQASQVLAAAGRASDAMLATFQAHRIANKCGCLTPALADSLPPAALTGREREVAGLAGQGLTNNEIAQRLFLSARTVEGHLYRISGKLGGVSRRDLARYFG